MTQSTGNPYTKILGRVYDWEQNLYSDSYWYPVDSYLVGDKKNTERYEDYFRVDVGMTRKGGNIFGLKYDTYWQIMNLTRHLNILTYNYRTKTDPLTGNQLGYSGSLFLCFLLFLLLGLILNFNQILKKLSLTIFLTFLSCLGENSWEDLESNYDHVLNVFGLISLDTSQHSYVGLYSTTDLGDTSQIYLGTDTIGWCNCDEEECSWSEQCDTEEIEGYWIIDSLFEPAALVKNASVTITDDNGNAYKFSFIESAFALDAEFSVSSINDVNNFRLNLYVDTSGTFYPQPLTNYDLDISAPGYDTVTGSLKTPKTPKSRFSYTTW